VTNTLFLGSVARVAAISLHTPIDATGFTTCYQSHQS